VPTGTRRYYHFTVTRRNALRQKGLRSLRNLPRRRGNVASPAESATRRPVTRDTATGMAPCPRTDPAAKQHPVPLMRVAGHSYWPIDKRKDQPAPPRRAALAGRDVGLRCAAGRRAKSTAPPGTRSADVVALAATDPFACSEEPPHSGAQEGKNHETIHQVHLFSLLSGCWETAGVRPRSGETDFVASWTRSQPPQARQASRNGQLTQFKADGAG